MEMNHRLILALDVEDVFPPDPHGVDDTCPVGLPRDRDDLSGHPRLVNQGTLALHREAEGVWGEAAKRPPQGCGRR